jgi:hypothetical protein
MSLESRDDTGRPNLSRLPRHLCRRPTRLGPPDYRVAGTKAVSIGWIKSQWRAPDLCQSAEYMAEIRVSAKKAFVKLTTATAL